MSRAASALLVALLGAAIAGCVSPAGESEDAAAADAALAGWWERAVPSSLTDPDHDHANRAHHRNLTTPNFEVIGYDPLVTDHYGTTLSGMGCGGAVTRDDGRRLAIVHSISTDVSFVVADVTDPAAPQKVGEFYMPNGVVWDADITADGQHVIVGAYPYAIFGERVPVLPPIPPAEESLPDLQILWRDACTGEVRDVGPVNYFPFGPGIVLVGIQDPANPVFEDWVPQPVIGPHSVTSFLIDGTLWATASVTNLNHEASYYTFFEVVETPAGGKLVPQSVIRAPGVRSSTQNMGLDNGHVDVTMEKHPVTGQLLAYLANWNAGMSIYDMSIPQAPRHVATWTDGDAGNVHTTYPFPELVDGRRLLAVGQEVGEPGPELPSGWTYILDITDPAKPVEVGRWTLPVKPKWDDGGLQFSPHYVAVLNSTMFVSNYHGGLWAVDITDLSQPLASGLFVPERDSPAPYAQGQYGPTIEDVIVDPTTGILTTWDNAGGIYTLRFHEDVPVPRAPAWVYVAQG